VSVVTAAVRSSRGRGRRGRRAAAPKTYTVESVRLEKLTLAESVFADEVTPGDCRLSRPAVVAPRGRRPPSRKAVAPIQQYNMVVGGLAIKKLRAFQRPCPDEQPAYLFYTGEPDAPTQPCFPAEALAPACWDFDNCTFDNVSAAVDPGASGAGLARGAWSPETRYRPARDTSVRTGICHGLTEIYLRC
jgi:hypothetical protein